MRELFRRILALKRGELYRLIPFLGLYLLLFIVLTMADGMSTALFVQRVGAASLPKYYALTAAANLVLIFGYVVYAERIGVRRTFLAILGASTLGYAGVWLAIEPFGGGATFYGLLFAARELSYTLLLMHFGTFLQEYFTRVELMRVLPIVYAGGRIGGIIGGACLEHLAEPLGMSNLLVLATGLSFVTLFAVEAIARSVRRVKSAADEHCDAGIATADGEDLETLEADALTSVRGFLRFLRLTPLMLWTTISGLVYMACRWTLNYQYNSYFEGHFTSDVAMAEFLGRYTQIALAASLVMQLVVVSRLVRWIGIRGAQTLYAGLTVASLGLNAVSMSFGSAVFSRVIESELRFGLRNPINQLITNKFSKAIRIRVRAWTLGALIPIATLGVAGILAASIGLGLAAWIRLLGVVFGLTYLGASLRQVTSFEERRPGP